MIKFMLSAYFMCSILTNVFSQAPTPFTCVDSDGFGYYTSSANSSLSGSVLTYSSSRLSKITTATGNRVTLCNANTIGTALNGLAFNLHDQYLYAVSRYDATDFSGKLYRIGENCQKMEIPVIGPIIKFSTNDVLTIDAAGGNISSATFDLDNHYYVNTSFANQASTGFTNKLQTIEIINNTAVVEKTVTLTCPTCNTDKLRVTDISFDEATGLILGSNKETNKLYQINPSTGELTEVGSTSITSPILGIYKNGDGNVRAISEDGNIYSVNSTTGAFTFLSTSTTLNSGNADAASGCYAPTSISGNLFIDANGLTDNTVNGIGTSAAGSVTMYANLIQEGVVLKSDVLTADGYYQFIGLSSGDYEVQLSSSRGKIGLGAPAQDLPSDYVWTGDNIGTSVGNDASPNGRQNVTISMGQDEVEVNFGINGIPKTSGYRAPTQDNPNGNVQVSVPELTFSDPEETNISNITIELVSNPATTGTLYYDGIAVTQGQVIPNYNYDLLTVDPVDGNVTVTFTFYTTDMADLRSNISTVELPFSSVVLPVELVDFTGRNIGGENILKWSTASEINNDYFIIEKRTVSGDFEEIGRIASDGKSSSLVKYSFVDNEVLSLAYYRLLQVDIDGASKTCGVVAIQCKVDVTISIYPTLATDHIAVELSDQPDAPYQYQIMDWNGRTVGMGSIDDLQTQLDISDLNNGVYYLKVMTLKEGSKSMRFIKI